MCIEQNQMKNGVYPASPMSWLFVLTFVLAFILAGVDPSFGMIGWIKTHFPWYVLTGTKVKAGLKGLNPWLLTSTGIFISLTFYKL